MSPKEIEFLKIRHQTFIRHQYFEGKVNYMQRMPYQSIKDFYNILNSNDTNWLAEKNVWLMPSHAVKVAGIQKSHLGIYSFLLQE